MKSEAGVQAEVRLEASKRGIQLFRNNSGVAREINPITGDIRPVRYGLGNESGKLNEVLKSSDLIGITPVVIRPEDVGKTLGVFTAFEVKKEGWVYRGTIREKAQKNFIDLINRLGGIAKFINRIEDL